ncbi:MAG: four helix bundle protein [Patescibacteria group bacterium]
MTEYHDKLKHLMNDFVHLVYDYTENFPKSEIFGLTSQIRRAALSIILNYIEGYARIKKMVTKNFLEISYGSLKESKYLVYFSYKRKFFNEKQYEKLIQLAEEIGKMLWGTINKIN